MAKLSIIIPVLHEQRIINTCIKHLKNIQTKNDTIQIIVVDGSPTQDTNQAITDSTVKKLTSKQGRGTQMNTGASLAKHHNLLFLHADVLLPKHAYTHIENALNDPTICAGAFSLSINTTKKILKLIAKLTTLRSRLFKTPYGDQAIFLTKTTYQKIGGYKDIPIMEDLALMQHLRKNHHPVTILKQNVIASPRRWEKEGIIASTLRNQWIKTLYHLGVKPNILVRFYQTNGTEKRVHNL